MNIIIKENKLPKLEEVVKLYNDVGWYLYTNDEDVLYKSIANSLKVYTLWDDTNLVGLARVVGDGYTIIYIQDILILEKYQSMGLGSLIINKILKDYKEVRQILLITEDTEKTVNFYKKNKLTDASKLGVVTFMK